MSWQTPLVLTVRFLIDDFVEPYRHEDDKIQKMLTIASVYASLDYSFNNDYIIDIENTTITPDPVDTGDDIFIALVTLKAACMFNLNQYQGATIKGIKVKSGDESFDTTSSFRGYSDILKNGPCSSYASLLKSLRSGGSGAKTSHNGRAVAALATHPDSDYGVYTKFFDRIGRY